MNILEEIADYGTMHMSLLFGHHILFMGKGDHRQQKEKKKPKKEKKK